MDIVLVGPVGLEPTTCGIKVRCLDLPIDHPLATNRESGLTLDRNAPQ